MEDYESFAAAVLATEITEDGPFSAFTANVTFSLLVLDHTTTEIEKELIFRFSCDRTQ